MKQNILYLNGMFRSGTTLMTQVLSAHPEMLVVGDPYVYFFKGYRNQFFEDHHQSNWIFDEPMPDYFHDDKIEFSQHLLTTDLQQSIKPHIRKQRRGYNHRAARTTYNN